MTETDSTPEIWQPIQGYETRYEVSTFGRIKRTITSNRWKAGRILTCQFPSQQYARTTLSDGDGRTRQILIHRVVVETFISPIPQGMTVNHIDGVKSNNRLDNLEIVSYAENAQHASRLGLLKTRHGRECANAKLTDELVSEFRQRHKPYDRKGKNSMRAMAQELGMSPSSLRRAVFGLSWKHVT